MVLVVPALHLPQRVHYYRVQATVTKHFVLVLLLSLLTSGTGIGIGQFQQEEIDEEPIKNHHVVAMDEMPTPLRDAAGARRTLNESNVNFGNTPPCRCWNTTDESLPTEIECHCQGLHVKRIPSDLNLGVHRITMTECGLETLSRGQLQVYKKTLRDFVLDRVNYLTTIEGGFFNDLVHLQRIYIHQASRLSNLSHDVFRLFLPDLRILSIQKTGLRQFPYLGELKTTHILHTVDLEGNQIASVPSNSVRLRVDEMLLNHNSLQYVEASAFNGSQIAKLSFRGNRLLVHLDPDAFVGCASMRQLDLSETSLTYLPTRGLSDLEVLRLVDTKTLKVIPSVYNFKSLQEAYLTYPYHCCAFEFPATHDPAQHARHNRFMMEMQKKYCEETDSSMNTSSSVLPSPTDRVPMLKRWALQNNYRRKRQWVDYHQHSLDDDSTPFGGFLNEFPLFDVGSSFYDVNPDGVVPGFDSELDPHFHLNFEDDDGIAFNADAGVFHHSTFTPSRQFFNVFCGNVTLGHRTVKCFPQPDAFNPCEDIMGTWWLRVAVWVVAISSVVGNSAVMIVLLSSRFRMTVSKILMVNLAMADLLMGVYLIMIAGMDLHSIGVYFNFAIDWQNGIGCQIAGFVTVFSTELSILTLVVITCERWYTITYAIHLNRRLRVSTTAKIMAIVWACSFALAILPILGVSSFSTTSICLPLENRNVADTTYLVLLLVINALAFFSICLCYGHMYHSIRGGSHSENSVASHSDATVAKRMALLVFTDFACLAPITFFGLTAVAGYPLISVTHSKILLVFFYPLNACTNPYLYAILTKQYRRDLFIILSRCGICTERADRYRAVFSATRFNQQRRKESQSVVDPLTGRLSGSGFNTIGNSNGLSRKRFVFKRRSLPSESSAQASTTGPVPNANSCVELVQLTVITSSKQSPGLKPESHLTIASSGTPAILEKNQSKAKTSTEVRKNSSLFPPERPLSVVNELSVSEENYSSSHQNAVASLAVQSQPPGASADSSHPRSIFENELNFISSDQKGGIELIMIP